MFKNGVQMTPVRLVKVVCNLNIEKSCRNLCVRVVIHEKVLPKYLVLFCTLNILSALLQI